MSDFTGSLTELSTTEALTLAGGAALVIAGGVLISRVPQTREVFARISQNPAVRKAFKDAVATVASGVAESLGWHLEPAPAIRLVA